MNRGFSFIAVLKPITNKNFAYIWHMVSFLRKLDFLSKIKADNLDVILKDSAGAVQDSFLEDCIRKAVAQTRSYLAHFYDVVNLFRPIELYVNTTSYKIGDFVSHLNVDTGIIYTALTDNVGKPPDANPTDWEASDPREDLLIMFVSDIALYHLHSRINPRNVPEIRLQRRDEAIKWLEGIKKGDVTPEFKLLLDDTEAPRIIFGTEIKKINSY